MDPRYKRKRFEENRNLAEENRETKTTTSILTKILDRKLK